MLRLSWIICGLQDVSSVCSQRNFSTESYLIIPFLKSFLTVRNVACEFINFLIAFADNVMSTGSREGGQQ